RSTAWCAADLCYLSVARRVVVRLTTAGRRGLLLYPALLSVGAVVLVSCAAEAPAPRPPQTSTVRRLPPQPPETAARPRAVPHPARKPAPLPANESPAPATGGEAVAATAQRPLADEHAPETSSPSARL